MTEIITAQNNILDTLLVLIQRKRAYETEGKAIRKLEAIYRDELKDIEHKMHKTA